jgi:hypothetical protein
VKAPFQHPNHAVDSVYRGLIVAMELSVVVKVKVKAATG